MYQINDVRALNEDQEPGVTCDAAGGGSVIVKPIYFDPAQWPDRRNVQADFEKTITMEFPMRIFASITLALAVVLTAAAPARAQTYDPSYPVCLQRYTDHGGYIECAYTSLAQCAATASGLAAQCVVNPYPARAYLEPGPHQKRSHKY